MSGAILSHSHRRGLLLPNYRRKLLSLYGSSLIGFFPLREAKGNIVYDISGRDNHGSYTGPKLADALAPKRIGGYAPYFDGATDYATISSVSSDYNGDEGTVFCWGKAFNLGVWTDGIQRELVRWSSTSGHYGMIRHEGSVNGLRWHWNDGIKNALIANTTFNSIDWFLMGLSWSVSNNRMRAWLNDSQFSTDQTGLGGAGSWGSLNIMQIGQYGGAEYWYGWASHVGILNREIDAGEFQKTFQWGA